MWALSRAQLKRTTVTKVKSSIREGLICRLMSYTRTKISIPQTMILVPFRQILDMNRLHRCLWNVSIKSIFKMPTCRQTSTSSTISWRQINRQISFSYRKRRYSQLKLMQTKRASTTSFVYTGIGTLMSISNQWPHHCSSLATSVQSIQLCGMLSVVYSSCSSGLMWFTRISCLTAFSKIWKRRTYTRLTSPILKFMCLNYATYFFAVEKWVGSLKPGMTDVLA